jgi:hypothetical protein
MHYHEQATLLAPSPETLALMAEWVLGLDELLYQCVDDDDLDQALKVINGDRRSSEDMFKAPATESSDADVVDVDPLEHNEDVYYQPRAIMGLYLYWFLKPIVRFPEVAGDAAVLLARLAKVYEPGDVAAYENLGRELNGMTLEARLASLKRYR